MNKQARVGTLTKIFILMVLSSLAFISMWGLYANVVSDYGEELNYEEEPTFREISDTMDELLNSTSSDTLNMNQEYINYTGTQATGEDSMIWNSFKTIRSIMSSSFSIISKAASNATSWFNIPKMWVNGFLAILLIVTLIVIIAGFLRTTNW